MRIPKIRRHDVNERLSCKLGLELEAGETSLLARQRESFALGALVRVLSVVIVYVRRSYSMEASWTVTNDI